MISANHCHFQLHSHPATQAATVLSLWKGRFSSYVLSSPVCQWPSSISFSLSILCFPPPVFLFRNSSQDQFSMTSGRMFNGASCLLLASPPPIFSAQPQNRRHSPPLMPRPPALCSYVIHYMSNIQKHVMGDITYTRVPKPASSWTNLLPFSSSVFTAERMFQGPLHFLGAPSSLKSIWSSCCLQTLELLETNISLSPFWKFLGRWKVNLL